MEVSAISSGVDAFVGQQVDVEGWVVRETGEFYIAPSYDSDIEQAILLSSPSVPNVLRCPPKPERIQQFLNSLSDTKKALL